MDKTIIIYRSKTGFSRRCALWLGEDLRCRAADWSERKGLDLAAYSTVILVSGLYAGQMAGLKWLTKPLRRYASEEETPHRVPRTRPSMSGSGASPAESPECKETLEKLFKPLPQVRGFYCQGGLDYEHMGAVDRTLMAGLRSMLRKDPEKAEMLDYISKSFDVLKRESLEPVLAWVRGE